MNPNRRFKDEIYDQFSRIGKAVSSPKRLELLDILCQGERTVEILARETSLTVANTSQHLQVLKNSRLVEQQKKGLYVVYSPAPMVCEFFFSMRQVAENRIAEIEQIKNQFLAGKKGMEPVDRDALIKRIQNNDVTILDVRPPEEFKAGHIDGALSVPLNELELMLAKLPKNKEIVAYCRGPYCVLSVEAVELLNGKGYHAVRLEEGVQDWRAMGLSVASGE
ncbi:MAG: metalloregulator ArsR/SmtB family transcription factor [Desulfobacula sp.]|jgi:rhodanese-related sulfurtransferase|uniref:ArsR/SmtB family transcription factor n=1 Tax=Desulfobacula sp. TaxID=2593537 RepID=UPI001D4D0380|nr:metalloregulator ArsR/SmtB family transcription factor [Desulfobacula sp.]MBT3484129.1 metalloregulator ArsR/SmtB family transcription factor [Desulfobacula sp.]MBT3803758.1 metalloregulator ArsR/SmtB family transcription factor [Desulfobacula sp.]MBT4024463.1 metalloregulator ArsR/SmtB family transcription factor [Desulfobacula sp.]MBT4198504.1 metalloregulator ArsR/SmtB family transcription factor [Desulfobacula sp.]